LIIILFTCFYAQAQSSRTLVVKPNADMDHPVPPSASFFKTIYYNAEGQIVKNKKEAAYYRLPVIKDGDRYEAEFMRMDNTRMKLCTYLPVMVNYQLSLEEGVGIKDGPYREYDMQGGLTVEG